MFTQLLEKTGFDRKRRIRGSTEEGAGTADREQAKRACHTPQAVHKRTHVCDITEDKRGEPCKLQWLPIPVLVLLWPAERVVVGMRTCKWLREELTGNAVAIVLKGKRLPESADGQPLSSFEMAKDLCRFPHQSISIISSFPEVSSASLARPVLPAMICALRSGLGHNLTSLDMSFNGMGHGDRSSHIWKLTAVLNKCHVLASLDLSRNCLSSLHEPLLLKLFASVRALSSLSRLDLSHNQLGDEGGLALAHSSLASSWPRLSLLRLEHNNLGDTPLTALAPLLSSLASLSSLDLSSNTIGAAGLQALSPSLSSLASLSLLDLSFNRLDPAGVGVLGDLLQLLPSSLHRLSLRSSLPPSLPPQLFDRLVSGLGHCASSLRRVDLQDNALCARQLAAIIEVLPQCSSLVLDNNNLDDEHLGRLSMLLSRCKGLDTLSLRSPLLSSPGLSKLLPVLLNLSTLRSLSLRGADLCNDSSASLSDALRKHKSLEDLNLSESTFGVAGPIRLGKTLSACPHLRSLSLSACRLRNRALRITEGVLAHCRHLLHLNLARNELGTAVRALAVVLKNGGGARLQSLDLSSNLITAAPAAELAGAIRGGSCSALERLDLGSNELGDEGASCFGDVLVHCRLRSLSLARNTLGCLGAESLARGLTATSTLTELDLDGNHLGAVGVCCFTARVQNCGSIQRIRLLDNNVPLEWSNTLKQHAHVLQAFRPLPWAEAHSPDRPGD